MTLKLTPISGGDSSGLQLGDGIPAELSAQRVAGPDSEHATLQTVLVAGRTYTATEPTLPAPGEAARDPSVGRSNSTTGPQAEADRGPTLALTKIVHRR